MSKTYMVLIHDSFHSAPVASLVGFSSWNAAERALEAWLRSAPQGEHAPYSARIEVSDGHM